jgi:hypothetical protein
MTSHAQKRPAPATTEHNDHAMIAPVRDLAERSLRGGSPADIDTQIKQAERNLAGLKKEFPLWMAQEFEGVEKAWADYKAGVTGSRILLFRKMHDMRGQAATFGYPLAGRAADNLCKLMDALAEVPPSLIEAHVQAVRVIIRENVNITDHPLGLQMVTELEKLGHALIKTTLRTEAVAR